MNCRRATDRFERIIRTSAPTRRSVAVPNIGMAHFQNHSLNQVGCRRIDNVLNEATTAPVTFEAVEPPVREAPAVDETAEFAPVV
ncbi:MAG TPA: hypothetical protein VF604_10905 [Pyrinomonadaceae bacterium]